MNKYERRMHRWVCHVYGEKSACREKVNYKFEEKARVKAEQLTKKYCKLLEAYPCDFCGGWHIGRALTLEERKRFYKEANGKEYIQAEELVQ
jgi:hypothetical protein